MRYYTSGNSYLQATINNSQRINLQGEEVEEISAEQKEYAQMLLNKRNEAYQQSSNESPQSA
nr:ProQ/FINO family protein [Piscirickettsia litoralis]